MTYIQYLGSFHAIESSNKRMDTMANAIFNAQSLHGVFRILFFLLFFHLYAGENLGIKKLLLLN
jgi:hypothetical protein